ncbi:hypothetical protein DXG01_007780 [Tephrocybe rancida]|nr:hypothetical protein DXG01_007780 [Tephrocybe rancida]
MASQELRKGCPTRVVTAMTMLKQTLFRYQGHVGAALVLGGVDATGNDALSLVKAAISTGIFNDLGSGSNIDACIITTSSAEVLRDFGMSNARVQKERTYVFRRGTTAWNSESVRDLIVDETITQVLCTGTGEAIDTNV